MRNQANNEAKTGEVFLGNADMSKWHERKELGNLKTIRLGEQAFDSKSNPLPKDVFLPLFIHQKEYDTYNIIMTRQMKFKERRALLN